MFPSCGMAFGCKPAVFPQIFSGASQMEYVMDEHQSNAEPNTPGRVGMSPRSVMETGTLASPPTTLPPTALGASPVDDRKGASIRRRSIMVVTAILAIDIAIPHSMAAGPKAAPPSQAPEYLPSISDLMIATIQPRHERLWRTEQDGNWDFAAYEIANLRGAFRRLGNAHPIEQNVSFPEMIASVTEQSFKELNRAVQAKDHAAFAKAYADLTDACNSCHQALNHSAIEIRVPTRTSASDLDTSSKSQD
jgi:hypothetical protein